MIFAHGPWFTEWHHLLDLWPAMVGGFASIGAWFGIRKNRKDDS